MYSGSIKALELNLSFKLVDKHLQCVYNKARLHVPQERAMGNSNNLLFFLYDKQYYRRVIRPPAVAVWEHMYASSGMRTHI